MTFSIWGQHVSQWSIGFYFLRRVLTSETEILPSLPSD